MVGSQFEKFFHLSGGDDPSICFETKFVMQGVRKLVPCIIWQIDSMAQSDVELADFDMESLIDPHSFSMYYNILSNITQALFLFFSKKISLHKAFLCSCSMQLSKTRLLSSCSIQLSKTRACGRPGIFIIACNAWRLDI